MNCYHHYFCVQLEITVGTSVDITMETNALLSLIVDFGDGSGDLVQEANKTTASNKYTLEGEYYITGE